MAKTRLTTLSKLLLTVLIVSVIVGAVYSLLTYTSMGDKLKATTEQIQKDRATQDSLKAIEKEVKRLAREEQKSIRQAEKERKRIENEKIEAAEQALKSKKILRVQLGNSANSMPGLYFNKGWKPNDDSRFFSDSTYKVEFIHIPDNEDAVKGLKNGRVDLIIQSIDEIPVLFKSMDSKDLKVIMQIDWSRGDYAICVRNNINTMNDLLDRKVALVRGSSSESYLRKALDAAGMSLRDIEIEELYYTEDVINVFNRTGADAMIIPAVQAEKLQQNLNLGKILQTTEQASHVIAHTFVAKSDFVSENKDIINQFYLGWMKAASEINANPNAAETAAFHYASELPYSNEESMENLQQVKLCNHADNKEFFSSNSSLLTGEAIYKEMGKQYAKSNLAPSPRPRWKTVVYDDAIAYGDKMIGRVKKYNTDKSFSLEEAEPEDLFSIKPLVINFPSGESTLTASSQSFIDVRLANLLYSYSNTRIRIEGNTENLGNPEAEKNLSEKRARAVASYLIKEYDFDPSRFIIQGNGSSNPVRGCETLNSDACKAKNRRTEFHFLKN